ncbi:MAG TPA: four helix bundle protein [Gemmatimonadales bacterium]|nr:four helix bundle protein [Gemmatimonadales bacterium]
MKTYKTLHAWQEAATLSREVILLAVDSREPAFWQAFDQLKRASVSIRINIAEGYALGNRGSFRRHLEIAYGSAVESGELLDLLLELQADTARIRSLRVRCALTERLLLGLIRKLKR